MKTVAVASTLALGALALAGPCGAQTTYRGQPYEPNAASQSASDAGDRGTVISITPIVQQVIVPRRVCNDEPMAVQRQPSGAGALIGAIAGGAMGNAVGAGAGRAAATAIGLIGGAAVGNSIESGGQSAQVQTLRRCTTENTYEDRTASYSVVYEYAGRQYTTEMRQDPGRYVRIQVQAAPEGELARPQYAPPPRARSGPPVSSSRPAPVYVERPVYQSQPEPVYEGYPVAPGPVYYEPAYAPLATGLVLGALIGYGVHHGYHRQPDYRWRGARR